MPDTFSWMAINEGFMVLTDAHGEVRGRIQRSRDLWNAKWGAEGFLGQFITEGLAKAAVERAADSSPYRGTADAR